MKHLNNQKFLESFLYCITLESHNLRKDQGYATSHAQHLPVSLLYSSHWKNCHTLLLQFAHSAI